MTEFAGLYTAVVESGPKEIERNLTKIPGIHKQEALDSALEKAISLSIDPKIQNIQYLLKLGADPNGPSEDAGIILSYAYSAGLENIVELLLRAGADINAKHSNVLEQAVHKGDAKYVVRFVENGAHISNKLLLSDNLLTAAEGYPEIQKYLITKGLKAPKKLLKQLENTKVLKESEFDYISISHNQEFSDENVEAKEYTEPKESEDPCDQLHIQDYSAKFFVIRGNTKAHQILLRKNGGRFIANLKGGKGWLVPISRRAIVEEEINNLCSVPESVTPVDTFHPTPAPKTEDSPMTSPESRTPDELDSIIQTMVSGNTITRPVVKKDVIIELYAPIGDYGFMTLSFTQPKLFYLDNNYWDSVERYLMYKMYEGSFKANAIKDADTLIDARKKFNVTAIPIAKTPKQLVLNQKLQPLVTSELNIKYLQHRENIFYRVHYAKFSQNNIFRHKVLNTGKLEIINKNAHDIFGYEGNLLGNTLMKLRHEFGGEEYDQRKARKTNNLIIEKYTGNKNFYVIRGDPDIDLAAHIRNIGTYKTKNGKVIRGKLNLNLQGGAGWLIPYSKRHEAKKLIFDTFPNEKKIELTGRDWVKKRMRTFVDIAIIFSRYRERTEVGPDDMLFSIKDVFGGEDLSGDNIPDSQFIRSVWKYSKKQDISISESAIQLLWNFLEKMVVTFTHGIETYSDMNNIINNIENAILDTSIKSIDGLSDRESIMVQSFSRLYRLLRKIKDNESKTCITVIHMMLGKYHYEQIREIYSKKSKLHGDKEYPDDESQFIHRFKIDNPHIKEVLYNIPKGISKKCKLLVLTTLDYIMALDDDNAINISKQLIMLSHKGSQPTPTPSTQKTPTPSTQKTPVSSTQKTPTPSTQKTPTPSHEKDSPPFEGTPVEDE